ncbi:MAG TPA: hypothetical protein DCS93_20800 [Microscillaceae bacterium]|nr:hypothetical protein [Microscillaceae bacterium]
MKKKNKLNIKSNWDKSINLSETDLKDAKGGASLATCGFTCYMSECQTGCFSCPQYCQGVITK